MLSVLQNLVMIYRASMALLGHLSCTAGTCQRGGGAAVQRMKQEPPLHMTDHCHPYILSAIWHIAHLAQQPTTVSNTGCQAPVSQRKKFLYRPTAGVSIMLTRRAALLQPLEAAYGTVFSFGSINQILVVHMNTTNHYKKHTQCTVHDAGCWEPTAPPL